VGFLVASQAVVALVVGVIGAIARRSRTAGAAIELFHGLAHALLLSLMAALALVFQLVLAVLGVPLLLVRDLVDIDDVALGSPLAPTVGIPVS